jgi:deoxyribonuclease-4
MNTLRTARALELETLQLFVSNPQGWGWPRWRPDVKVFAKGVQDIGLSPVVVHATYLINLASPDAKHREPSVRMLAAELVAASALGADLVVVHSGSHMGSGEEKGADRLAEGIRRAREIAGDKAVDPIIENTVGAGTQLCSTFDALAGIAEKAGVRVCVDTAHAYVSGYDLSTPDGAREVAAKLRTTLGERLALLHLNDARNELGSHRDGHERVGEGRISQGAWVELLAALPGVPVVMETPHATPAVDAEQVRIVKKLAGGLPLSPLGV